MTRASTPGRLETYQHPSPPVKVPRYDLTPKEPSRKYHVFRRSLSPSNSELSTSPGPAAVIPPPVEFTPRNRSSCSTSRSSVCAPPRSVEEVTWDDVLGFIPRRRRATTKTVSTFRMSPPRPASGATYALCNDNTFIKGHYLTPDAVMDLKEALSLRALEEDDLERRADTAAEEEEEEEEALSESDAASVDSLLAREIVEPFEFDILRTDA